MWLFAQARAAEEAAGKAFDSFREYGLAGLVIATLFIILIGGLCATAYFFVPLLFRKWATDLEWYQGETKRQDEAHEKRMKEQAEQFIGALKECQVRFTAELAAIRTAHREEVTAVVEIWRDKFHEVNQKLDQVLAVVESRSKNENPRRG